MNACQPVGGQSVWAHHGNIDVAQDYVLAVAGMDSISLFHDLASGADETYSALAALLAASDALSSANVESLPTKIIYGVFQAEAWGRIGSRKFVDDLINFQCNNLFSKSMKINTFGQDICLAPLKVSLSVSIFQLLSFY